MKLTPIEQRLLFLFRRDMGQVLHWKEIAEFLSPCEQVIDEDHQNLRKHICQLRRKLGPTFSLATVLKWGYRLDSFAQN